MQKKITMGYKDRTYTIHNSDNIAGYNFTDNDIYINTGRYGMLMFCLIIASELIETESSLVIIIYDKILEFLDNNSLELEPGDGERLLYTNEKTLYFNNASVSVTENPDIASVNGRERYDLRNNMCVKKLLKYAVTDEDPNVTVNELIADNDAYIDILISELLNIIREHGLSFRQDGTGTM